MLVTNIELIRMETSCFYSCNLPVVFSISSPCAVLSPDKKPVLGNIFLRNSKQVNKVNLTSKKNPIRDITHLSKNYTVWHRWTKQCTNSFSRPLSELLHLSGFTHPYTK